MKIIFLCGSLEPGQDGVGDYVRRLACELIKQGHQVAATSINDAHVTKAVSEVQTSDNVQLSVLRIGSGCMDKRGRLTVKQWINEVDPDWISLQFVPFAFHSKGLPFNLSKHLKYWGEKRRWHIMFHELWVGMDVSTSIKERVLGWLQKYLIRSLIARLQPAVIHTQARLYQFYLDRIGVYSRHLPLFSNITRSVSVANAGMFNNSNGYKREFSLVVFGSIHPGAPVEMLADEAARYRESTGARICLEFIGLCGSEQDHWVQVWESHGLPVKIFGKQNSESVSKVLNEAAIGISTTPPALLDKSGSVAAMLEHDLPVITVSRNWRPRGADAPLLNAGIREYVAGSFAELLHRKFDYPVVNNVSNVARNLASTLTY